MPSFRMCPVCEESTSRLVGELAKTFNHPISRETFDLMECVSCQTIYQSPLPTSSDFGALYRETPQFPVAGYSDARKVQGILDYYTGCVNEMRDQIMERHRVLEIGAGPAWICRVAKALIPGVVTVAQDVTPECVEHCDWVDHYLIGDLATGDAQQHALYTMISLTHVLEHLPDPVGVLAIARRLLVEGGRMLLTFPHRPENWPADPSIGKWSEWAYNHVPGHLQYFSEKGIGLAASRSGFEIGSIRFYENGQSMEVILRPD